MAQSVYNSLSRQSLPSRSLQAKVYLIKRSDSANLDNSQITYQQVFIVLVFTEQLKIFQYHPLQSFVLTHRVQYFADEQKDIIKDFE